MAKRITCECGHVVHGANDDELVQKAEEHIRSVHPELVGQISRDDLLAMAVEDGG